MREDIRQPYASEPEQVLFLKVQVSLAFSADDLDPDEITSILSLPPTWAFKKNQEYVTHIDKDRKGVRHAPVGVWGIQTDAVVPSKNPQNHVDHLIRLLRPKVQVIKSILARNGYFGVVRIHLETMEPVTSFGLRADSLADLASLCHEIGVVVIVKPQQV